MRRFISHIASRWTFIKIRQVFSPYAVPWDCGFVIPWLFSPSNCYFPFQTRSHKMASGGGLRPPPPSLALTSHRIARHRIARYHMLRGCSAAPRRAADHALIRGTKRAQHQQRIMQVLMLPARATCWLTHNRNMQPRHPARPPQPARTIIGPGPNAFELLARRGCRSAWTPRRLPSGLRAPRLACELSLDERPSRSGRPQPLHRSPATARRSRRAAAPMSTTLEQRLERRLASPCLALPPWITHASDM